MLILIIAGYAGGFFIYREYTEKIAYFDQQAQFAISKFSELEKNLNGFSVALENSMDKNKIENKKLLSRIKGMRENVKSWEKGYMAGIAELKGEVKGIDADRLKLTVEMLKSDIDKFKVSVQDMGLKLDEAMKTAPRKETSPVDLGRISIKK